VKPEFVAVDLPSGHSFLVDEVTTAGGSTLFNYHMGCQITLLVHGHGERWIGDHVVAYHDGDLAMMGPYLPHMWRESSRATAHHAVVVYFPEDFLGEGFLQRPELACVQRLITHARRGLEFRGATRREATRLMRRLPAVSGLERLLTLLALLRVLAEAPADDALTLASGDYARPIEGEVGDRLTRVFQHIHAHLDQPLGRNELARLVGLSDSAFSRFFVARVGRALPDYLNDLRIGRACRLLMDGDEAIAAIARRCGYGTLANFNRRFLAIKGMTPSAWRTRFVGSDGSKGRN
jgi:AraC-like DNA-binding protein/quercetin dioxygenase-like cupin family protein